jgi:hypothetical protein
VSGRLRAFGPIDCKCPGSQAAVGCAYKIGAGW